MELQELFARIVLVYMAGWLVTSVIVLIRLHHIITESVPSANTKWTLSDVICQTRTVLGRMTMYIFACMAWPGMVFSWVIDIMKGSVVLLAYFIEALHDKFNKEGVR